MEIVEKEDQIEEDSDMEEVDNKELEVQWNVSNANNSAICQRIVQTKAVIQESQTMETKIEHLNQIKHKRCLKISSKIIDSLGDVR